jgi:hypothetical protein
MRDLMGETVGVFPPHWLLSFTLDSEFRCLATDLRLWTALFLAQPFHYSTRKHVNQNHYYKDSYDEKDDGTPTEFDMYLTVMKESKHTPMLFTRHVRWHLVFSRVTQGRNGRWKPANEQ